jgi:predicted dehydrogenase
MSKQIGSSRRDFLKSAAAATSAFGVPTFIPASVLGRDSTPGANDTIILGAIGLGGRCNQLIDQVPEGAKVVAAADCYLQRAVDAAKRRNAKWGTYQDYREMFDKEKLDGVIIATPDHARTLPCIRAVQAGLDVYAEKPLTAYLREGRILVDHVRKNKRILQVGSQQRTMEVNRFCCAFVRVGMIVKVKQVSAVNYPGPR